MKNNDLYNILQKIAQGQMTVEEGALILKKAPFEELEFAKIDYHRSLRQGVPEVIYGEGKTSEQIIKIVKYMEKNDSDCIIITRLSSDKYDDIKSSIKIRYDKVSRIGIVGNIPKADGIGKKVIATVGTSDMPITGDSATGVE